MRSLFTSPDGKWIVARDGRKLVVHAATGPAVGKLELDGDDADVAMVGPPGMVIVATRAAGATHLVMHAPPDLDIASRVDFDITARIATVHSGRIVIVSPDGRQLSIVRAAGRGLSSHTVDLAGAVIEFAVGIERNQLVIGQQRKLEVWDGVSGRPLRKLALDLPPPPRTVGAAAGHIWVTRPSSDEVFIYRLSDGRPFRHYVGAPIDNVICHPLSPLIVMVTARGLVRLNCYAHSLLAVEVPAYAALALLVNGDEATLVGLAEGLDEPWHFPLGGGGATAPAPAVVEVDPGLVTAADKLRAMRSGSTATPDAGAASVYEAQADIVHHARAWRDALATFGQELARGVETEPPAVPADSELGELARRLGLSSQSRRALVALYALHLVGEPALALSRLSRAVGDWAEALGTGELAQLAMLERDAGKVALRTAVTDAIDGAPPRELRLVGGAPQKPRAGAFRIARDGRTDAAIEAELATQLGRIGVVEGRLPTALLEARLHGATAVSMVTPTERPRPWPTGAGLILVLYGAPTAWVADLPAL